MSNKFIGSVLPGRSVVVVLSAFLAAMLFIGGVSWHGDARAVSGAIGALGVQGSEPEQEPNETAEQANQMTIPGQRTGTVRYGDAAQLEFVYANGPRDRIEDLYSFKIPEKTSVKIDVQLTFANSAADLDLILYQKGAAGKLTPLGVSNGSATTERIVPEVALETGDYLVGVTAFDNPDNTAQTSYTLLLSGGATAPVPVITGLNPISASAGSGAFSLVVNGRNFYAGQSVVRWNDQARPTTFIHSEQLVAFLTAADVASAGSASVTVVNPASLGGASSPASFQVLPAGVPEIEAEPNDGSAEATSLGVPGKRSGSVGVGDTAGLTLTTMTGHADPVEDLYAVNLMESRRLDLRLTGSNLGSDLALYLLQEKETPGQFAILGNSRLKGPVQQITTSVTLPSGRYLVGVSAVSGQSGYVIEANVPADRRLQLGPASAAPGSTISVPVTFSGQGTENQMTFSVAFDPARMSGPVFVNGPALADARVETDRSEVAQGRLGISLRLPEGQSFGIGLVEIGRLDLALAAGGQVQNSRIDFADRPVVRTLVDRSNTALIGSYEGGTLVVVPGFEADLVPRPFGSGDGRVTIADWTQTGRFIAGIDAISDGSEFQRADCAPKSTNGDGRLTVADWVLAGRYAAGLEPTAAAAGPSVLLPSANSGGQTVKVYQPHPPGSHSQVYTSEMAEQEARSIRVRPDLFSRGRENELVIELVSKGDENALGFSLVFDTSQLTYLRAATGSDASGAVINVNSSQVTQGRIGIGLALPTGQTFPIGLRQIVRVAFAVPNGGTVNTTTIGFIDQPVSREVVDPAANVLTTVYTAGEIRLDPPADLLPKLESIEPSTLSTGGTRVGVTLRGANFVEGTIATVAGSDRQTTFVSNVELRMEVLPEDLIEAGALDIQVRNPPPGGGLSNKISLMVINPVPVIEALSPETAGVGGATFTLSVTGSNFVPGSEIEFNGRRRVASWSSSSRLSTQITAADTPSVGTVVVRVINPEPGGGISNPVNFSIRPLNPVPRITSISPTSLEQGVNPQLVVITGTNFVEGATVVIGSDRLPATYVSPTELRLNIDGNRFRTTGGILLLVSNPAPGGGNSNWFRLTIVPARNPIPVLTAIAPATVFAGGENVTLTLTGSSFIPSSRVLINGEVIPSVYISASVLTVRLSSEQLVTSEAIAISVVNPEPGGGGSAPQLLTVLNPPPVLSALTPDKVVAGGPAFTLTLTGAGFVPESKIVIDGAARAAGYVSSTQLTLQVRATEITTLRTIPVQVVNPAPGGGSSKVLAITVRQSNPVPRVAAIRPSEVRAGGPGFILSVEGSRFTSESILRINGQPRDAEFVSESILAASIDPSEIAVPGELQISVLNPAPGGGQSGILPLRIVNPVPRITTINPIEVLAGGPELDLIVFGEGFASTSIVTLNESPLATTLVTGSQLRARIPAALTALGGLVRISVSNPSPGGGASNSVNLTIKNPTPSISRLIPASLPAGAGEANLTVEGAGFVAGSILLVNGQSRPATLVNSSRLSAKLPGVDTITAGMLSISVLSPEPAGGLSGSLQLIVENPAPQLTSLSQTSVVAGSPGFRLVLTGLGFLPGSVVRWSGIPRSTVYISDKSLAVDLLPADLATVGSATVAVFNPSPGGGSSAALTFSITPLLNVTPVISSITPATAVAGSPEVIITVNGSGFISGSTVLWAGSPRPTNLISPTQLTARISSSDLLLPGTFNVSVATAGPGGGTSNQQIFLITFLTNVCQTVCLQSADYYLENLDQIPRGTIWVEGALYEVAAGSAAVRRFLSDTGIIAQQLTREFTATQLSVNISKDRTAVLNSRLSCYLGSFNPILLSSGSVVREQTTLNELFGMAREAVTNGRESESQLLLQFFQTLNGNYPYDRCR